MMTVYEVFDNNVHGDHGRYYRTLKEAKSYLADIEFGHLTRVVIPTPITKNVVIALLNQEGYATEYETIAEKR